VQAAQGLTPVVTVLRVVAEVWRFLYRLQSRLQTTEPLAVAVAVAVAVEHGNLLPYHHFLSQLMAVAVAVAVAEQVPLTLQVELAELVALG
jgi:hypothetical protein